MTHWLPWMLLVGIGKIQQIKIEAQMIAMNAKPGQSVSMFLIPAHTSHNKSSVSTYNDDTALAFEDVITARTRDSDQEEEMKLSATISDSTISGDTMAVFETVERDKESVASGNSDMDITSVATATSVLEKSWFWIRLKLYACMVMERAQ
ncbi:hypothetical protein ANCCAN_25731 [Ancylostoma caninum]|uniref:Uncharacterized protein n=1 Tax=Ancylostoma caninum TaxID=29170 RepID=A0A368FCH4_ANCCA|nr:hypothetical protein ANCCAN_25731 [Ancylostoma caninum]